MPESPTQRTLKELRKDLGWTADVAEYWQPSFASRAVVDAAVKYAEHPGRSELQRNLVDQVRRLRQAGPGKRQDLFGFVDIVAISTDKTATDWLAIPNFPGPNKLVGIQCTTASAIGARYTKIVTECADDARRWLETGNPLYVVGWREYKKTVNRRRWRSTWRDVTLRELEKPF